MSTVQLTDLVGASKDLSVPFANGAALDLTYDPTKVTSLMIDTSSTDPTELAKAACRLVTAWDLADKDGDIPVGPGSEGAVATRVPLAVLSAVFTAIVEDNQPNPTSARS
jgi:hypothetical protein